MLKHNQKFVNLLSCSLDCSLYFPSTQRNITSNRYPFSPLGINQKSQCINDCVVQTTFQDLKQDQQLQTKLTGGKAVKGPFSPVFPQAISLELEQWTGKYPRNHFKTIYTDSFTKLGENLLTPTRFHPDLH